MSRFLLEQLDKKFVELEEKKDVLLGQDEDEDTTDEANVTGNMDGGAGPIKTPNAFAKSTDEDDLNIDNIEVSLPTRWFWVAKKIYRGIQ